MLDVNVCPDLPPTHSLLSFSGLLCNTDSYKLMTHTASFDGTLPVNYLSRNIFSISFNETVPQIRLGGSYVGKHLTLDIVAWERGKLVCV